MNRIKNLSKKQLRNRRNSLRNKLRGINKKRNILKGQLEDIRVEILMREVEG